MAIVGLQLTGAMIKDALVGNARAINGGDLSVRGINVFADRERRYPLSADLGRRQPLPAAEIRGITSVLTMVGGRIVHGAEDFAELAPPLPPASPAWSPAAASDSPGWPRLSRTGAASRRMRRRWLGGVCSKAGPPSSP